MVSGKPLEILEQEAIIMEAEGDILGDEPRGGGGSGHRVTYGQRTERGGREERATLMSLTEALVNVSMPVP